MNKTFMKFSTACLLSFTLSACDQPTSGLSEKRPPIVEAHWTRAAAEADERLNDAMLAKSGRGTSLPRLRAYDSQNRLIYVLDPAKSWTPDTIGSQIDAAAKSGAYVEGPSFAQTVGEFELADGRPAATVIKGGNGLTVFDYWADWCVPCKILEKALRKWAAEKPQGTIQLVHAEADNMKLAKERGETIIMSKVGPDGKKSTKIINPA